jgi:hypothetical protein
LILENLIEKSVRFFFVNMLMKHMKICNLVSVALIA